MQYNHLTHDIPNIAVTEYEGRFLITVPDGQSAAIVLERVIKYGIHCWIGLQNQSPHDESWIYAAYPLEMWIATVATLPEET